MKRKKGVENKKIQRKKKEEQERWTPLLSPELVAGELNFMESTTRKMKNGDYEGIYNTPYAQKTDMVRRMNKDTIFRLLN